MGKGHDYKLELAELDVEMILCFLSTTNEKELIVSKDTGTVARRSMQCILELQRSVA